MSGPINLKTIIEELEIQFEESRTFYNNKTGEIILLTLDDLRAAEGEEPFDHLPDWQKENRMMALDVMENDEDYIEFPTKYDINEYEFMEDFCMSVRDELKRNALLRAIRGKGAFRRFKDMITDLDVEEKWYSFRDERYKEIAIDWCKDNNIDYIE